MLGAGLTGLSTAWHLRRQGIAPLVVEVNPWVGGLARSLDISGSVFDIGVHIFYFQRPEEQDLLRDLFGDDIRRQCKKVAIHMDFGLVDYPYQANLHQVPEDRRIQSLSDLAEAGRDGGKPANFLEWLRSTYGGAIAEDFLIPHNAKLMRVPLDKVSAAWAERFFPRPNVGQIVAGAFRPPANHFHPNQYFVYPNKGGSGRLAEALAESGPTLLGRKVVAIDLARRLVRLDDGAAISYDRLVSTLPLKSFLGMVEGQEESLKGVGERLLYSSLATVFVRASRQSGLAQDGYHWLYFPQPDVPFQRLSFMENFAAANAPAGQSGICLECPLAAGEAVPGDLGQRAVEALQRLGVCAPEDILSVNIDRQEHGYPLYHDTWHEDVELIDRVLLPHNVLTTGRNGHWQYSNMEDALAWGRGAAQWCAQ